MSDSDDEFSEGFEFTPDDDQPEFGDTAEDGTPGYQAYDYPCVINGKGCGSLNDLHVYPSNDMETPMIIGAASRHMYFFLRMADAQGLVVPMTAEQRKLISSIAHKNGEKLGDEKAKVVRDIYSHTIKPPQTDEEINEGVLFSGALFKNLQSLTLLWHEMVGTRVAISADLGD